MEKLLLVLKTLFYCGCVWFIAELVWAAVRM